MVDLRIGLIINLLRVTTVVNHMSDDNAATMT